MLFEMKLDNETAKTLKQDFPIFENNPGLVYLDNAATSQRPKQVIKALVDFYEHDNGNVGRGTHMLAEKAMEDYNAARKTVAAFINAKPEEIIFTRNTTESINLLSYVLDSLFETEKNEILLTEMEHHSNLIPWQELARRKGMALRFVKIKSDFTLDMDDLKEKLTDRTAIFSFAHVSNVLGTVNDVKQLSALAKQKGAITMVDAAQSVQHMKLDVKNIGCDFLVFSSHKMLGPFGIGVLFGKREFLERLKPFNFGGGMIKKVDLYGSSFADIPERFEAGTQNIAGAVALARAIKYIENIGLKNIGKWESELTKYALDKLRDVKGIKLYTNKDSSSIISFNLNGIHPHDVAELLNRDKIAIRPGHMCAMPLMERLGSECKGGVCRISFSIYNTFEDIDKLVASLNKIKEKFG